MFSSLVDLMPKDVAGADDDDNKKNIATPNSKAKEMVE